MIAKKTMEATPPLPMPRMLTPANLIHPMILMGSMAGLEKPATMNVVLVVTTPGPIMRIITRIFPTRDLAKIVLVAMIPLMVMTTGTAQVAIIQTRAATRVLGAIPVLEMTLIPKLVKAEAMVGLDTLVTTMTRNIGSALVRFPTVSGVMQVINALLAEGTATAIMKVSSDLAPSQIAKVKVAATDPPVEGMAQRVIAVARVMETATVVTATVS
jgi:hypothetical protein